MASQWQEIGNRLRAHRLGRNLTASELADAIGISRAALYRLEKGELVKVETLERLADVLQVSLSSLLGFGVEYYDNAVGFFERMRQLEQNVVRILGNFTPVSFLLLSDEYVQHLRTMLLESAADRAASERDFFVTHADRVLSILKERRKSVIKQQTPIMSVVTLKVLERFLRAGLVGRYDLAANTIAIRRQLARREIERLVEITRKPPNASRIGIVDDFAAEQTFQVFDKKDKPFVTLSPYRLGDHPNISAGIAMVTPAPDAVKMFKDVFERQWDRAAKGKQAAKALKSLLIRTRR
jgi:transcriptional regulator with XRE-family HTH domain